MHCRNPTAFSLSPATVCPLAVEFLGPTCCGGNSVNSMQRFVRTISAELWRTTPKVTLLSLPAAARILHIRYEKLETALFWFGDLPFRSWSWESHASMAETCFAVSHVCAVTFPISVLSPKNHCIMKASCFSLRPSPLEELDVKIQRLLSLKLAWLFACV